MSTRRWCGRSRRARLPHGRVNTTVAIHPHLRALTLRVILQTIFGSEDARLGELHTRLLAMFAVTGSLTLQEPQLRRLPGWRGIWRRFLLERARVDRDHGQPDRRRRHSARSGQRACSPCCWSDAILMADQTSTGQIRDTLMSVILAGHETTASELAWAFQLLAHDPLVAGRLVDDLDAGGEGYLTATIQEVLRHRPVFLFTIPRVVRRPFEIAGTTYRPPVQLVGCHPPHAARPEPVPRAAQVPARALPRRLATTGGLDAVGRWTQAMPRSPSRDARDAHRPRDRPA